MATPSSLGSNVNTATVPSVEHAMSEYPSGDQHVSTTDCVKHVLTMHTGFGRFVAQTVILQSCDPHAITVCGVALADAAASALSFFPSAPASFGRNSAGEKRTVTTGPLCPTKSNLLPQSPRSSTDAVWLGFLYELHVVTALPSGDQHRRNENVAPIELWYGSVILDTTDQSSTRQTMTLLSSACVHRYLPMGSHATPLTKEVCPFRVCTFWPVRGSHTITMLSSEHEANIESSGAQAMSMTSLRWPRRVWQDTQFSTLGASELPNAARPGPARFSYRNTFVSVEPEARNWPFFENRTQLTVLKCSLRVARIWGTLGSPSTDRSLMDARFHTFTFWSPPAVAMRVPSGWQSTEKIGDPPSCFTNSGL